MVISERPESLGAADRPLPVENNDARPVPLMATALPEALFTGVLIALFAHLAMPDQLLWTPLAWIYSALAAALFLFVMASGFRFRRALPWRWWSGLGYCLVTAGLLFLWNTSLSRLIVILLWIAYAFLIYYLDKKFFSTADMD